APVRVWANGFFMHATLLDTRQCFRQSLAQLAGLPLGCGIKIDMGMPALDMASIDPVSHVEFLLYSPDNGH
ncbi:hypothetical protein Q4595_19860, partial [Wenyingzhuangia sp. 1_MG-2023]|nr:hypothetical protein [Wenyingzhuangia sp. 1_MG-2023]